MFIVILLVIGLLIFLYLRIFKIPKCGNMTMVTGGIKTGKSTLSVRMCIKLLRKQRIKRWIHNHIKVPLFNHTIVPLSRIICRKDPLLPIRKKARPMLYSNIPLRMEYIPLTEGILLRSERVIYGSVVYVCESSLVADSQSYKDKELDEPLLLFNKLFGHSSKGGYLVYDTQSIADNHHAIKKCLNTYLWIHHNVKIPFFVLMWVREMSYSYDQSGSTNVVNTVDEDAENDLKLIVVPKSTWNKFDCFCYSVLTDDKPVITATVRPKRSGLKARKIVSFKKYKTFDNDNT